MSPASTAAEHIVIVGATSAIARSLAQSMAQRGCRLVLAGREIDELERIAADLRVRHRGVAEAVQFDATAFDTHPSFVDDCVRKLEGRLDGLVLCHGTMSDQREAERDFAAARHMIDVNYTSAVSVLNIAAERMEQAAGGPSAGNGRGRFLCVVSSVAGDRGRPTNYIYGSTKAGLDAYLEGLRARLFRATVGAGGAGGAGGVAVINVKPGFVDTAMTWGLLKDSPLVAGPERIARDMERAIRRRSAVVYTPWFWRLIMAIVRSIPRPVFNRMRL